MIPLGAMKTKSQHCHQVWQAHSLAGSACNEIGTMIYSVLALYGVCFELVALTVTDSSHGEELPSWVCMLCVSVDPGIGGLCARPMRAGKTAFP